MRHGQVALEFLTTYAWAMLVILTMIGALAYFGFMNPDDYVPSKCNVDDAFICKDYFLAVDDGSARSEAEIVLENAIGQTLWITSRAVLSYNGADSSVNSCGTYRVNGQGTLYFSINNNAFSIGPSDYIVVYCDNDGNIDFPLDGETEKISFSFKYSLTDGGFDHDVNGDIISTVLP
ncbi:hypothetical protein GOV11_04705 [Candidatus Woesearchaeota archaeon]|nr:hypothetical protein [Candidatus Woesearchaeota archaeon]